MRPTFLGFETAKKGLSVSQKALDITGNNLVNVKTPGYSRQRVDQVSVSPSTYSTRYATSRTGFAGQGVDVNGISQIRDSFLDKRFREEYGDVGYYDQYSAILSDIEAALDESVSNTGLKNAIKEVYTAISNFASNADSKTHANIVATAFKNITQVLHQFDTKLANVAEQQKFDLQNSVTNVNSMFEKVASLNKTISEDLGTIGQPRNEYYGPNELLDERNLLLDELSRYGDLSVQQNADGTVTLSMNGHTVVDGKQFEIINYQGNTDGTVGLNWQSTGKTVELTTGSLKAAVDMLNGRGPGAIFANEGVDKGILYYRDKINTFAKTLVQTMNSIVPQTNPDGSIKTDGNGNTLYKTLLGARTPKVDAGGNIIDGEFVSSADVPVTAENITISDDWVKDSSFLIFSDGDKTSTYANAMLNALTKDRIAFYSTGEVFNGTFEEFVNDYVQTYGAKGAFNKGRLEAAAAVADDLLNRRDEVSAVNPDEETTNMMLFQKSYQAAARLMTALDEALDVLINRTGLVGR